MQRNMKSIEGKKKLGKVRKENNKDEIWMEENLCGMELSSIPNHLTINLACITKLDLSCNNLESLSESATARLANMVILDLHSNQLKRIPNSIGCLSKLKRLNASSNSLDCLPNTIQNCRALEELLLNFNQLTQIPETICLTLTNLRLLSIHSNKLTFIPSTINKLASLCTLDVHLNSLRNLPKDLHLLPSLHSIDVSQNFQHFNTLPYSIGLLPSLSNLNISYNCITTLPDSLACATGLRKLTADGNPLVSPTADVVERGVDGVRDYLIGRMKGRGKRKKGWMKRIGRCGIVDVGRIGGGKKVYDDVDDVDDVDDEYNEMVSHECHFGDGFGTPGRRYMEVLASPLRIFSRQKSAPTSPLPLWK